MKPIENQIDATLRRFPDLETLSHAAAETFVQRSKRSIDSHGRFVVALAGGSTPKRTYQLLAEPQFRDRVDWERVEVFWGDERCVPLSDSQSNARMAKQAFLDRVAIPNSQIHTVSGTKRPQVAAAEYETLLRQRLAAGRGRFDLVLLGLGEDGHTASLFPGNPTVDERTAWVSAVTTAGDELDRITLTAPALNQTDTALFLVATEKKSQALWRAVCAAPDPHRTPATLIHPDGGSLLWFVDFAAGQLIDFR